MCETKSKSSATNLDELIDNATAMLELPNVAAQAFTVITNVAEVDRHTPTTITSESIERALKMVGRAGH